MATTRKSKVPDWLRESPLADVAPPGELAALGRLSTLFTVPDHRVLFEQNAAGRDCVVVIDGSLEVERDGAVVATVPPGHFAGELALLTGQSRSATVRADGEATLAALNRRELATLLDTCPQLGGRLLTEAVRRAAA